MNIIFHLLFIVMLCLISYQDFKEHYINDWYIVLSLFILFGAGIYNQCFLNTLYGFITGLIIGFLCYGLGFLISKSESFGMADVFLLTVIGSYLGWFDTINFFIFVSYFNGIILLPKILLYKKVKNAGYPMAPLYSLGLLCFILLNKPNIFEIRNFICKFIL